MLHRLSEIDVEVREAYANFDFARVVSVLSAFLNTDLSAFYFDVRKDALYCEPASSLVRLGALETVERLFRAVTVWLAPILVFTTEEAWGARYPNADSVHLEQFPEISENFRDPDLAAQWDALRKLRSVVTGAIEISRAAKEIGASLEAHPVLYLEDETFRAALTGVDFAEVCIVSDLTIEYGAGAARRVPPRRRARARRWWSSARPASNARARGAISTRDGRPRVSRRDAARREGAARMARAAGVSPRLIGLRLAAAALALDQASKYFVTHGFESGALQGGPLLPILDLALRYNRGVSFSLLTQNGALGARQLLTAFSLAVVAALLAVWLWNGERRG